jgi:EF hand
MTFQSRNLVLNPSRSLLAGAALTLLAFGGAWAQAQALAPSDKPMTAKEISDIFAKADANKDGKLDKAEADTVTGLAARFDQVDADGDKMISKAEYEKAMKQ